MNEIANEKRRLRAEINAARDGLAPSYRVESSGRIADCVLKLPAWHKAQTVLLYAPIRSEVNVVLLWEEGWKSHKRVCLPRIENDDLEIYQVSHHVDLAVGPWGIQEPLPGKCPQAMPEEVDLVVLPGLAFDCFGGRLGYGKGFYDRFLLNLRDGTLRIMVAFEAQKVSRIPVYEGDLPVDIIITECAWYGRKGGESNEAKL